MNLISGLFANAQKKSAPSSPAGSPQLRNLSMSRKVSVSKSAIDKVHDNLILQMSLNDDHIRTILRESANVKRDFDALAASSEKFAGALGSFSKSIETLVNFDIKPNENGPPQPDNSKQLMLMAAMFQLSKYYYLLSESCQELSHSIAEEFETHVSEKQNSHRSKCEAWTKDFEAAIIPLVDKLERNAPESIGEQMEMESKIDEEKKKRICEMAKCERHHIVHFVYRLQRAFKTQLNSFRSLYRQEINKIPDLIDTKPIKQILEKNEKPSQMYLQLRRPSDATASSPPKEHLRMNSPDSGFESQPNDSTPNLSLPVTEEENGLARRPSASSHFPSRKNRNTLKSVTHLRHLLKSSNIDAKKARVLYTFEATSENDLDVRENDTVEVLSVEGEWAYCLKEARNETPNFKMGWVPLTFISVTF